MLQKDKEVWHTQSVPVWSVLCLLLLFLMLSNPIPRR